MAEPRETGTAQKQGDSSSTFGRQIPKPPTRPRRAKVNGRDIPALPTGRTAPVESSSESQDGASPELKTTAIAVVLAAVIAGVVGFALGHGSTHKVVRAVAAKSPVASAGSIYGPPGKPIEVPPVRGSSGISATAALQAHESNLRLTLSADSHLRYEAVLYSSHKRPEELFASSDGRDENVHLLSIQHLLAYPSLRFYVLLRSKPKASRLALELSTSQLAKQVIK